MGHLKSFIHTHPVNVAGYLATFLSGLVSVATNPAVGTVLSTLPQSRAVSVASAVVTCIAAIASAYRNKDHAAQTVGNDIADSLNTKP